MPFEPRETITTRSRLRELMPLTESRNVLEKDLDRINDVAERFIKLSPFVIVATKGMDGRIATSPKGDPAGFVEVYDSTTLIIPERLGNSRVDTFENLLEDSSIGLIFMIPGHTETLRISGLGRIALDPEIQSRHAINEKKPLFALVIDVEQVFMHCSKAVVRSKLWQATEWTERRLCPSLAEWVKSAVRSDYTVEELQGIHDNDASTRLY